MATEKQLNTLETEFLRFFPSHDVYLHAVLRLKKLKR